MIRRKKFKKSPGLLKDIEEQVSSMLEGLWVTSFTRELQDQIVLELIDGTIGARVLGDDENLGEALFGDLLDRFCEMAEASGKTKDSDKWILETCAELRKEIDRIEKRVRQP